MNLGDEHPSAPAILNQASPGRATGRATQDPVTDPAGFSGGDAKIVLRNHEISEVGILVEALDLR